METEIGQTSHAEMSKLLRENNRLLEENNKMLHTQERRAKWALLGKILWFAILIGLPLVLYWYLRDSIEALFGVMQSSQGLEAGIDMERVNQLLEMYNLHQ